jgi:peptidoglycan/LPS O-acetylase OafA/YrhL
MRATPQTCVRAAPSGYQPALDGLRAVSILLVVASHLGVSPLIPGGFGVTLFFFISGYLITGQLLKSLHTTGRIGFAGFYLRRALRLLPAGLAYIVVAGLAFQMAGGSLPLSAWAAAIIHGANYADIWGWFRSTLHGVRHPFNILWSLAIEEHFYVIWPAALAALRGTRRAIVFLVALCAVTLLWRIVLLHACFAPGETNSPGFCGPPEPGPFLHYDRLYFATDTRLDAIAYGALMALLETRIALAGARRACLGLFLLILSFALTGGLGRDALRGTLQGIAFLALVPWLNQPSSWPYRLLCLAPFLLIGRLSYSLYLWHWAALGAADIIAPHHYQHWFAIAAPLSCVLAAASYWGIERPMLRVRRRFGSHVKQASASF